MNSVSKLFKSPSSTPALIAKSRLTLRRRFLSISSIDSSQAFPTATKPNLHRPKVLLSYANPGISSPFIASKRKNLLRMPCSGIGKIYTKTLPSRTLYTQSELSTIYIPDPEI